MTPGISLIVFLAGAFGLIYAIEKTKNSTTGVYVLLAFTFFMGLMLSRLLALGARDEERLDADHDGVRWHGGRCSSRWRRCPP